MARKNAIDNKSSELTIDPGASGDSFVQFDINATGEFRVGVDDTAADAFKISQGSALGTNDTFVMTAAGERTMPIQPSFNGIQQSVANNVTGNGAVYTLGTTAAFVERFDQGGHFTTAGTFTAPVTGNYHLNAFVELQIPVGGSGGKLSSLKIVTSNKTYFVMTLPTHNTVTDFHGSSDFLPLWGSVFCDMDASDTVTITVTDTGGSGNNDDIYGDASNGWTVFSGALIS